MTLLANPPRFRHNYMLLKRLIVVRWKQAAQESRLIGLKALPPPNGESFADAK